MRFPIVKATKIVRLPLAKTIPAEAELFLTISPYGTAQERNVALERIKQLEEEKKHRKEQKPPPRILLVVNTNPQLDTPQDVLLYKRHLVKR